MSSSQKSVGFIGLTAIVIGSMIGGGAFNLPSNMAGHSALGPIILAWIITGFGMYFLANTFKILSDSKPELSTGIYSYAAKGFGRYVGFNSAWGYWLSAGIGDVSFAILMVQAFGYFFPVFEAGNNWQSIVAGSLFIWLMNLLVSRGVKGAALLNIISTIGKIIPLMLFLITVLYYLNWDKLRFDFWGEGLGSINTQLRSTMLVTLWAFIGIEGAVVISDRARNKSDVGKATLVGFLGALILYASISIFTFGILNQAEIAKLDNPSLAYVMQAMVGNWGAIVINIGVIISILGAWIAWTIITAEVPSAAAAEGVLPKILARQNRHEAPVTALTMTSIIMQVTLIFSVWEKNAYLTVISIAGSMILVPYVLSSLYLIKLAFTDQAFIHKQKLKGRAIINGMIATGYGLWLIYAAGLHYTIMSTILYALGILVYRKAWKDQGSQGKFLQGGEKVLATLLVVLALLAIVFMFFKLFPVDLWVHHFKMHRVKA